jgi:hypothetical protein
MVAPPKRAKKAFISAVVGMGLVALCCFTPVLVIVLSLLGVSFLTPAILILGCQGFEGANGHRHG